MLGAIAGDMVGSVYEARPIKTKAFALFSPGSTFTDDTVLTVATAQVLLHGGSYADAYRQFFRRYPHRGFGGNFAAWAASDEPNAYGSFGNGAAMRVSPIAWVGAGLDAVSDEAARSAAVTHDHPEGIKGAQATAMAVFLARTGATKTEIRDTITARCGYDLTRPLDAIRQHYAFDVSCQGSVPESIVSFLASVDFEDAVRNAVSLGGDSDTMACIAGAIAEAFYGAVPDGIARETLHRLDPALVVVVQDFETQHGPR